MSIGDNKTFNKVFKVVEEFVSENDRLPETDEVYKGINIGKWCDSQIDNHCNNNLSNDQINKLNSIGFELDPINETVDFATKNPLFKECKFTINARLVKFNDIMNQLNDKLLNINTWNQNFELLEEFVSKYNRLPKQKESYKNIKLGKWCSKQKVYYKQGKLSKDKIDKLESINFNFDIRTINTWDQNFNLLKEFISKYNRSPKQKESYKYIKLGSWCEMQKIYYRKGKLSQERIDKLKEIGALD